MAKTKDLDRRVVSVLMRPPLYDALVRHCREQDVPVSVWCRELIRRELVEDARQRISQADARFCANLTEP